MTRWAWRLVTSGLRSDARWLIAVVLSIAFALAALVPVQALSDASLSGLEEYAARAIGADVRIVLDESSPTTAGQVEHLIAQVAGYGAQVSRAFELPVSVVAGESTARLRLVLLEDERYPYYGGEQWSAPPSVALTQGAALSTNAIKSLRVTIGDRLELLGSQIYVAASFPESLLTLAASGTAGTVMLRASAIWSDGRVPQGLPGAILFVSLPVDPASSDAVNTALTNTFGASGLYHRERIMPVVEVGLVRLKQTFFWCALLIIFICTFGVSFGVEDYLNSKSDEIATLKMAGIPTLWVGWIILLRLIAAGVIAAILAVGIGSLMVAATISLAGSRASDIASLTALSRFPWEFIPIGVVLLLALGSVPLLLRLREKPHRVLWSKMRGAPLTSRTAAGVGSLFATIAIAVPVMMGLGRWYLGRGQTQGLVLGLMAACAIVVLSLVFLLVRLAASLRFILPAALNWPLTYLHSGSGRTIAATTAVALALAVGTSTALLDRAIDWELQAAIRDQVPFSVMAVIEHGVMDRDGEAALVAELTDLDGVEVSAFCDVGYVFVGRSTSALTPRAALAKAVRLDEAALFGSDLAQHIHLARPGTEGCTLWEEATNYADVVGTELIMVSSSGGKHGLPQDDPVALTVLGLDPRPGLRVGLNAPLTVAHGVLRAPEFRVLGVRTDPAYSSAVVGYLEGRIPYHELHDLGAVEVLLRSAAEELSFVWWATSIIALLVSIVIFLTTSSVARMVRTYDLAMLRVIGIAGRRLAAGPYTEAVVQGLVAGFVGSLVACLAVYKGLPLFFSVQLPAYWIIPAVSVGVALIVSVALCAVTYRLSVARPPLEVLRSE